MTFSNVAARDAYVVHPEHERVKAILMTMAENVLVFDFEV
jgi:hypothetical protein